MIHYMIVHNKVRAQRGAVHIVQSRLSQVEVGVAQLAIWLVRGVGSRKHRVHRPPGARRWNEGEPSSPLALKGPPPPPLCGRAGESRRTNRDNRQRPHRGLLRRAGKCLHSRNFVDTRSSFFASKRHFGFYPARARSAQTRRARALGALGLLLADGAPTVGGGKTF